MRAALRAYWVRLTVEPDTSCEHKRARGGWEEDALATDCTPPIAPANTWSNGAYAVAAVVLPGRLWPTALALVLLAIGSGLYHACKTRACNRLDRAGMGLVFGVIIGAALGMPPWAQIGFGLGPAAIVYTQGLRHGMDRLLAMLLVPTVLLGLVVGDTGGIATSLALFALAWGCWRLDRARRFPVRGWGHACWHLGTAVAIAALAVAVTT